VIYRQLSVSTSRRAFEHYGEPSGIAEHNDLLNSTIVQIVIGNRKGIRLPATPDNSYRNTRFAAYAETSGACVQTWWRATEFATKWTRTRWTTICEAADCFDAAAARLAGDADQCQDFAPHFGVAWDPFSDHKTSVAPVRFVLRAGSQQSGDE